MRSSWTPEHTPSTQARHSSTSLTACPKRSNMFFNMIAASQSVAKFFYSL